MSTIPSFHKSRCQKCKDGRPTSRIDWSWIDHVYCISLKDREDRAKEAELEFHKVGLCDKVMFYRPTKDTSDYVRPGTRGCWTSHRTIAKKGYEDGAEMVLVFEDDVEFDEQTTTPKNIQKLASFTKKLKNWNIIYLGQWSFLKLPTGFLNLHRDYAMAAHAYLISNDTLKWLSDTKYEDAIWLHKKKESVGFGLDVFYMFASRAYSYFPMMAYQRGAKTSNQRPRHMGKFLINLALTDPRYMKYNQYLIFALSVALILVVFLRLWSII